MPEIIILLIILTVAISTIWAIAQVARQSFQINADFSSVRYKELKGALGNLMEIERLVQEKQKATAIKLVRDQLQLNLRDARWLVDLLEIELRQTYLSELEASLTDHEQVEYRLHSNKIAAIKVFRLQTGANLRDARDAVELMYAKQPIYAHSPSGSTAIDQDDLAMIIDMLVAGRKITAIKLYCQKAAVDMKEAQEAIEALEAEKRETDKLRSVERRPDFVDSGELHRVLKEEGKITAIKYYRQCTGVGIKDAKEAIEHMARQKLFMSGPPQTMV